MIRTYLKLQLWFKAQCEQMTFRQRRIFLYCLSSVYFLCSVGLIISAFIPQKEAKRTEQNIPSLIDTPIRKDSLYQNDTTKQFTT